MVIGLILLGAELFVIEADFYLVFIGVSAILTGLFSVAMPEVPMWIQWLVFALVSLVSMVFFRKRVYQVLRPGAVGVRDDLVGLVLRLPDRVAPGENCRVEHLGSTWRARNDGPVAIESGARARVIAVDGIVLSVRAEE